MEDICQQELLPEGMKNGLQPLFVTCCMECSDIAISQGISSDHLTLNVGWKFLIFAKLSRGNSAFGALAVVCTGHKCLLRIITDKNGQNRMTSVPDTVTAHHHGACLTT